MENKYGRTDREESVWTQIEGNWNQLKGKLKQKWGDLTDDDLRVMEGRRDRIVGKIQERYGKTKWLEADIERELRDMSKL